MTQAALQHPDSNDHPDILTFLSAPETERAFLNGLKVVRTEAVATLRNPRVTVDDYLSARASFLASEAMLRSHAYGRTNAERTSSLMNFIQAALTHKTDQEELHINPSRRSVLSRLNPFTIKGVPETIIREATASFRKIIENTPAGELHEAYENKAKRKPATRRQVMLNMAGGAALCGAAGAGLTALSYETTGEPLVTINALRPYPKLDKIASYCGTTLFGALDGAILGYGKTRLHDYAKEHDYLRSELEDLFSATMEYCSRDISPASGRGA